MKKLFILLAVASLGFVACNNEAESTKPEDTIKVETPEVPAPVVDSLNKAVDSLDKKVDSLNKAN